MTTLERLERRTLFRLALAGLPGLLLCAPSRAGATLVRGLTLGELVGFSDRVVLLSPLEAISHWAVIGGQRLIVTDTRVHIEESMVGAAGDRELMVRTLGGRVGSIGELVAGQAELNVGESGVGFLKRAGDGLHWVTGMGQGHYPLSLAERGLRYLRANRSLPTLVRRRGSAVERLPGTELTEARRLIQRAGAR